MLSFERFPRVRVTPISHRLSRAFAHAAALEEHPESTRKKERLSRQERTALVESFVLKHMDSNDGAFPSVSVVLKGTGGGRNMVKDIMSELERRYVNGSPLANASQDTSNEEDASAKIEEQDQLTDTLYEAPESHSGEDWDSTEVEELIESRNGTGRESSHDNSLNEEYEVEDEEGFRRRRNLEQAGLTLTNGQMTGASKGEIETHSELWSRLRGIGSSSSPTKKQGSPSQQEAQQKSHINGDGVRMGSEINESAENDSDEGDDEDEDEEDVDYDHNEAAGFAAMSYPEFPEGDEYDVSRPGGFEKRSLQTNGMRMPKDALIGKYGLFVRYLSPQATAEDMREAFQDCGEIVRTQPIKSRVNSKFTYGFVDFKTPEGLKNALDKPKVYIRGVRIQKEPASSTRGKLDKALVVGAAPRSRPVLHLSEVRGSSSSGVFGSDFPKRNRYLVSVEGLPLDIPLLEVEKALSVYGEVVRCEIKHEESGACCAHMEFQTEYAQENAIRANAVHLRGMQYPIMRVDPFMASVVRLTNLHSRPEESQIAATCELFGRVEKVVVRSETMVDVYFQTSETKKMPRILNRLNEVNMDGRRWQAEPAPRLSPDSIPTLSSSNYGQEWLQHQSERMLQKVENTIKRLTVDVEDLQELVRLNRNCILSSKDHSRKTTMTTDTSFLFRGDL